MDLRKSHHPSSQGISLLISQPLPHYRPVDPGSALLLDGLFQCESYARTIIETYATSDISETLSKRMARKAILDREDPPQIFLIMSEGILRQAIGGARVMRDQLWLLIELSKRPMVQVQVVPEDIGYHKGLGGGLNILDFDEEPSAGYVESAGVGVILDQPDQVAAMAVRYDLIRGHALSVEESRAMIQKYLESYEQQAPNQVAQEQP